MNWICIAQGLYDQQEQDSVGQLSVAVAGHSRLDGWNAAAYLPQRVLDGAGVAFVVRSCVSGEDRGVRRGW
ncbi:hypothetical protein D5S18_26685 [Nocardia panacis]|uniref:Uncharacterized protein n=1 Tax=Nocardia panacis TaxID=2340916 RepID=A0A3A4KD53_9NOCA|nr:hypothetical protein [Nocardia panacis]RJO70785.1 hypothetical protein D5S18_26685 [Nocardia panacis]